MEKTIEQLNEQMNELRTNASWLLLFDYNANYFVPLADIFKEDVTEPMDDCEGYLLQVLLPQTHRAEFLEQEFTQAKDYLHQIINERVGDDDVFDYIPSLFHQVEQLAAIMGYDSYQAFMLWVGDLLQGILNENSDEGIWIREFPYWEDGFGNNLEERFEFMVNYVLQVQEMY